MTTAKEKIRSVTNIVNASRQLEGAGIEIGAAAPSRSGMTADGEQHGDVKWHRGPSVSRGPSGSAPA